VCAALPHLQRIQITCAGMEVTDVHDVLIEGVARAPALRELRLCLEYDRRLVPDSGLHAPQQLQRLELSLQEVCPAFDQYWTCYCSRS
jgi:hypothetical protein